MSVSVQSHAKPGHITFIPYEPSFAIFSAVSVAEGKSHFTIPPICDCHASDTSDISAAAANFSTVFEHCPE